MRNNLLGSVVVILASVSTQAQVPCSSTSTIKCRQVHVASARRVFEHLVADSPDLARFNLSTPPTPQYPVHIFRNGIELAAGVDYQLVGQTMSPVSRGATSRSADYQAAYYTQDAPAAGNTSDVSSLQTAKPSAVLAAYLDRSLTSEFNSVKSSGATFSRSEPSLTHTSATRITAPIGQSRVADDQAEPASMRMLRELRVERAVANGLIRQGIRGHSHIDEGDSGFEGTGDLEMTSVFGIMRDTGRRLAGAGPTSVPRSREPRSEQPPSERMLREVLTSRQPAEK